MDNSALIILEQAINFPQDKHANENTLSYLLRYLKKAVKKYQTITEKNNYTKAIELIESHFKAPRDVIPHPNQPSNSIKESTVTYTFSHIQKR